ncbi:MAG: hypothetical protein P4M15_10680, partial [Alphaproteobacteria bacterium]|nr:hypothetical protein [Alphaproteobacteria bacterium]
MEPNMLGKLFARLARPAPRIDAQPDWDKARAILSQQGYFHMEAARDTELCAAYFEGLTLYRREQARGHSAGSFSTLIRNGAQQSFVLFAVEEAGNKEVCRVAHIIIEARDYYRPLP